MIFTATVEDSETIAALHASCFEHGWSADYFQRVISDPFYLCLKAVVEGEIIGFLLAQIILPEAEILSIGVRKEMRRQGYGRRLLQYLIDDQPDVNIFLEVAKNNPGAINLYDSLGFKKISERKGYYCEAGQLIDAIILSLQHVKIEPLGIND